MKAAKRIAAWCFALFFIFGLGINEAGAGVKCNNKTCADDEFCWEVKSEFSMDDENGKPVASSSTTFICKKDQPSGSGILSAVKVTDPDKEMINKTESTYSAREHEVKETITKDESGEIHVKREYEFNNKTTESVSHEGCNIKSIKDGYLSTCYSCVIVANLISVFMDAASKAAPLMQSAGLKLLFIGMIVWLAFFVLNKLSSFVSLEPMSVLNELFQFLFKCLLAYVLISSGVQNIVAMGVNPILKAGADYGIAVIDSMAESSTGTDITAAKNDTTVYKIQTNDMLHAEVFDKIMEISKRADAAVSLNFVIGNALMCHATHEGAYLNSKISFSIPNVWLWLCGIVIWFFAFLLVMGVNFYLLDLSFKLGFSLLALPITMGLWPFNRFKGKFGECFKIIINAAGTFMFLGITTGLSIMLIGASLGGTDELLEHIENGDAKYVSEKFALTGPLIMIVFAYLYSHKLISETVSNLTDKFFKCGTSGLSPINEKTTQAIDFAKKQVGNVLSLAAGGTIGVKVNQMKNAAKRGIKNGARSMVRRFSGNSSKKDDEKK